MQLNDFLDPQHVLTGLRPSSKKNLLQTLSQRIAALPDLDESEVFAGLVDREKLGSTGAGRGIAVPHCRIAGLTEIVGLFARLDTPVDFDSVDDLPVDLVFVLLAPEDTGANHLKALSLVSRLLRDNDLCAKLRAADTADAAAALLMKPSAAAA